MNNQTLSLVEINNGNFVVSSVTIAEEFGRQHGHVLRTLDSLTADGTITQSEYGLSDYIDSSGKRNKCYLLTEEGFLIAMPFVGGKRARAGQRHLVKAFTKARRELLRIQRQKLDPAWVKSRKLGIEQRKESADAIQRLCDYATAGGSSHGQMYHRIIGNALHRVLFGIKSAKHVPGGNPRDVLNNDQRIHLMAVEDRLISIIDDGIEAGIEYHAVARTATDMIETYRELMQPRVYQLNGPGSFPISNRKTLD